MDAIYNFLTGILGLSGLNAVLFAVIIWMVHKRFKELLLDLYWAKKQLREHEMTFLANKMIVVREPERGE